MPKTKANVSVAKALILAGCFDKVESDRAALYKRVVESSKSKNKEESELSEFEMAMKGRG